MDLAEVLRLECCTTDIKAENKDEMITELSRLMQRSHILDKVSVDRIKAGLMNRESQGSTGFGHGIAIPHCQISGIDDFVVGIAICKKGIDFGAIDRRKVKVFVIIVGPQESRSGHLQLLALVSRILREPQIIANLLAQTSKIGLLDEFLRHDPGALRLHAKGKEKLVLIMVKDADILDEISEVFVEYGIEEATIIDTASMKGVLSNVPLFLGFFDFTGDRDVNGKLIMVKLPKGHLQALVQGLEDEFGDLDDFTGMSLIAIDIFFSKGL